MLTLVASVPQIRDTLNNLIVKSPQSWQTSVGLPFFQIEGVVVEWDVRCHSPSACDGQALTPFSFWRNRRFATMFA